MKKMTVGAFRFYMRTKRTPKPITLGTQFFFNRTEIAAWKPDKKKAGRPKVKYCEAAYAAGTEPRLTAKPKGRKGISDD